ncbi:MAG: lysophospholipid acyltransferase family protein [Alphaproteobacteria bacterium]
MGSPIRALCRLVAYLGWTLAALPLQVVALVFSSNYRRRIPPFYHRISCRILGLDVRVLGTPSRSHPVLFVVNHSSYLDISVLGSILEASFVAKSEVKDWPFFGLLAKLQRTVFVDRAVRSTAGQRDAIVARLEAGDDLILFPEGTSSDGNRVLPFKSALLSCAETSIGGRAVTVQPVSVAYTRLDGMPLGRNLRPFYAWYGDMDLISHIWHALGLGNVTVEVNFHPATSVAEHGNRKALTRYCERAVIAGVAASLSGRAGGGLPSVPAISAGGVT